MLDRVGALVMAARARVRDRDEGVAPEAVLHVAVLLPLAVAFLWFALLVRGDGWFTGDEPHYLVITQALWLYHTLDQYQVLYQHDFFTYFPHAMSSHSLHRDGHLYPLHYPGLSLVLLPGFALMGAAGALATTVLVALLVCWRTLCLCRRVAGPLPAALAVLSLGLAAPFVQSAATIYPDLLSALLLLIAYEAAAKTAHSLRGSMLLGVVLAFAPWVHAKLLVAVGAFLCWVIYSLHRHVRATDATGMAGHGSIQWRTVHSGGRSARSTPSGEEHGEMRGTRYLYHDRYGYRRLPGASVHARYLYVLTRARHAWHNAYARRIPHTLVAVGAPVLSVGMLLLFNKELYGSFSLTAQFSLRGQAVFSGNPFSGLIGQVFAQGQGALGTAPVVLLAIPGAVALWRCDRVMAARVILVTVPFWLFTLTYHDWWGGDCPPLRYLLPMLPFWTPGIAVLLAGLRTTSARLTVALLGAVSLILTLALPGTPRYGWPCTAAACGASAGQSPTLITLGNTLRLPLARWLPTFTVSSGNNGTWHNALLVVPWAVAFATGWYLLACRERAALEAAATSVAGASARNRPSSVGAAGAGASRAGRQ